jgi:hypothetical protein
MGRRVSAKNAQKNTEGTNAKDYFLAMLIRNALTVGVLFRQRMANKNIAHKSAGTKQDPLW